MRLLSKTYKNKMFNVSFCSHLFLITLSSFALSSCASMEGNEIREAGIIIHDPMENTNRQVMAFNQAVDKAIIHPIVKGYRTVTPQPARSGIRNFLRNLRSPLILVNQLLQGDLPGARDVVVRAAVNTTVGIGGLFDVAGYEGIEYEQEDFGQTLAVWGVEHGPYMVVPLIGPSSMRDYAGYITDSVADPLRWYLYNTDHKDLYTIKAGVDYLDLRDSLMDTIGDLESSSIDYYAAVRSTYYQHREALIHDRKGTAQSNIPAIPYYEDE